MFGGCVEEADFNLLCLFYSAWMPASPFQDKETLKEVQKAPQETIPLPIGWWFRCKMRQTWSCCSRAWSVLFWLLTGLRVRGRGLSQKEKEISVQVSFRTLLQWRIWWVAFIAPIRGLISVSNIYWYFQREAIKSPRSTRRRPRRGVTSP